MQELAARRALKTLKRDHRLEGVHVPGRLDLLTLADRRSSEIGFPVRFVECVFDELYSPVIFYQELVEWTRCVFKRIHLTAGVYFKRGLLCRDSEFQSEVEFDSGGHNERDAPIVFERVRFHGFVDFFDSWFTGPIVFRDVEFLAGTNLLNEEHGWVVFDVPPVLERVSGPTDRPVHLEPRDGGYALVETSRNAKPGRRTAERT